MEAQHTPGPWHKAGYGVLGPKGVLSDQICVTLTSRPLSEREANARLIAAAPDLLLTLRSLESRMKDSDPEGTCKSVVDAWLADVRAAIQNAEKGA